MYKVYILYLTNIPKKNRFCPKGSFTRRINDCNHVDAVNGPRPIRDFTEGWSLYECKHRLK